MIDKFLFYKKLPSKTQKKQKNMISFFKESKKALYLQTEFRPRGATE